MNTERRRTELRFSGDERFLAGVRGAIEHVANRHALTPDERADLTMAAGHACRAALVQLDKLGALCAVTIDDFEDRVEVSVESPRNSEHGKPNPSAEKAFAAPADERDAEIKKRVDRVDYDMSNGRARTILVKYFHKNPAHS